MDYLKTAGCCTYLTTLFFAGCFTQNSYLSYDRFHPTISLRTLEFLHVLFVGISRALRRLRSRGCMHSLRYMRTLRCTMILGTTRILASWARIWSVSLFCHLDKNYELRIMYYVFIIFPLFIIHYS